MSEEKKEVVVPEKFQSLVAEIEKMSVLDLAELVSVLEDKFGVSAAAPAMMMAPGAAAGGDAGAAEEKQNFNLSTLDLPIENPTEIWTYNNVDEIFILEPKNKRIIIFDKEGKLIKQITNSNLKEPTSMVIDTENKTLYLLDNGKIYKTNY